MAGQRIIASNRIPRVRIANRGIATPLSVSQGGGVGYKIGDITWAPSIAAGTPGTFEDASVSAGIRLTSDFPNFYAAAGPGPNTIVSQNVANIGDGTAISNTPPVAWNGAIYGTSGAAIRKKTTPNGSYGATLWSATNNGFPVNASGGLFVVGAKLIVATQDGSGVVALQVATDDVTRTAEVAVPGTGGLGAYWAFDTGVANTYIVNFTGAATGIARTTNGGASWTLITASLTGKNWLVCWRSGTNLFMISQDGFLATSVNDGATWGISGAAVPGVGAGGFAISASGGGGWQFTRPGVVFDLPNRLLYAIGCPGVATTVTFMSIRMDSPATGFSLVMPSGTLNGVGGAKFGGTATLMFLLQPNSLSGMFVGMWQATLGSPSLWSVLSGAPPWGPGNVPTGIIGFGCTFAGQFIVDTALAGGGSPPASWSVCDGVVNFERVVISRNNANRPFIRML